MTTKATEQALPRPGRRVDQFSVNRTRSPQWSEKVPRTRGPRQGSSVGSVMPRLKERLSA